MKATVINGWETSDGRTFLDISEAKDHERLLIAKRYAGSPIMLDGEVLAEWLDSYWKDIEGMITEMRALEELA